MATVRYRREGCMHKTKDVMSSPYAPLAIVPFSVCLSHILLLCTPFHHTFLFLFHFLFLCLSFSLLTLIVSTDCILFLPSLVF